MPAFSLPSIVGVARRTESALIAGTLRRRGVVLGRGARFLGWPVVSVADGSTVAIGQRFVAASRSSLTALGVSHPTVLRTLRPGAVLEVGDDVGISGGSICAAVRVTIGEGCLLGADVTVVDTDFHPVHHPLRRYAPPPAPRPEDAVSIGRNVFIGTRAIILRGSHIGDHAVVGAGAVVRGPVEAGTVVAGNPARRLRGLDAPLELQTSC